MNKFLREDESRKENQELQEEDTEWRTQAFLLRLEETLLYHLPTKCSHYQVSSICALLLFEALARIFLSSGPLEIT